MISTALFRPIGFADCAAGISDTGTGAFSTTFRTARFRDAVEQDMTEGRALGITGTPTFFVNGRRMVGAMPVEAFREAVRAALTEDGK